MAKTSIPNLGNLLYLKLIFNSNTANNFKAIFPGITEICVYDLDGNKIEAVSM